MGPEIELKIAASPGLWRCHVDQGQLESALVNLAINARDAMPSGGTLTISLANVTGAKNADEGGFVDSGQGWVAVVVADTGVGMPRQVLEQAVDPFFTTKMRGQGTGLGLSMVYGFVNQSGGEMHIDSAPGKGTRVTLRLPRADGPGMAAETAA